MRPARTVTFQGRADGCRVIKGARLMTPRREELRLAGSRER